MQHLLVSGPLVVFLISGLGEVPIAMMTVSIQDEVGTLFGDGTAAAGSRRARQLHLHTFNADELFACRRQDLNGVVQVQRRSPLLWRGGFPPDGRASLFGPAVDDISLSAGVWLQRAASIALPPPTTATALLYVADGGLIALVRCKPSSG